jgi:hypothetical protein
MFSIHFDDHQINVYSPKAIDIILRCGSEIESISKDLYQHHNRTFSGDRKDIKYDYDAIEYFIDTWKFDERVIKIISSGCHFSDKLLTPFKKGSNDKFDWNEVYQALKHDRISSIHEASINNTLKTMSALYLLNLYYLDSSNRKLNNYKPNAETGETSERYENFGSSVFSLKYYWH